MTTALTATNLTNSAIQLKQQNLGDQAREAGVGFESLLLGMMLEPLETSGESFFGGGASGRTFGGLYREKMAVQIAQSTPLGVASLIEESILRQGMAADSSTPETNLGSIQQQIGRARAEQSYERLAQ